MQLRWSLEAAADLERLADYLLQQVPDRAAELLQQVYEAPNALLEFPHRGRPGKKAGTRELILPTLPYLIVYRVDTSLIFVVRVLHGAQKWP